MKASKLRIRLILDGQPQVYRLDRDYEYLTPSWDRHISDHFQMWDFIGKKDIQAFDTFHAALTFLLDR